MSLFVNIVGKRGMIYTKNISAVNNFWLERSFYINVYLGIGTRNGDEAQKYYFLHYFETTPEPSIPTRIMT